MIYECQRRFSCCLSLSQFSCHIKCRNMSRSKLMSLVENTIHLHHLGAEIKLTPLHLLCLTIPRFSSKGKSIWKILQPDFSTSKWSLLKRSTWYKPRFIVFCTSMPSLKNHFSASSLFLLSLCSHPVNPLWCPETPSELQKVDPKVVQKIWCQTLEVKDVLALFQKCEDLLTLSRDL